MTYCSNTVVIDNGTGYTKMGFAGNPQPAFDIPTLITDAPETGNRSSWAISNKKVTETLDFEIGYDATKLYRSHRVVNPIQGGIVRNWDLMEKFWHRSIFDYLRCDPEETVALLTEPPLNPPENRESMAEIMFQTFNMKGLYIGVQAVLALMSAEGLKTSKMQYTGTVLDSGDGVTHVIPVVDGFVISSCIRHIPLAGSNITAFIASMLRDRHEKCPTQEISRVAKQLKEQYGYVATSGDLVRQFEKFDQRFTNEKAKKKFDRFIEGVDPVTKNAYKVAVGPERFLGPEMFFHPEIINPKYKESVDEMIDKVIQLCPIDTRRKLYANIALSGGSTLFKGFSDRLETGLKGRVAKRLTKYEQLTGHKSKPIDVNVIHCSPEMQRYAVWLGGSYLASSEHFHSLYHTRQDYFERGSSICRYNAVFSKG